MIQISTYTPITPIQPVNVVAGNPAKTEAIKAKRSDKDTVEISEDAQQANQSAKDNSKEAISIYSRKQLSNKQDSLETTEAASPREEVKETSAEKNREIEESPENKSRTNNKYNAPEKPQNSGNILNLIV